MLDDLDKSLKELLRLELPPDAFGKAGLTPKSIGFGTPGVLDGSMALNLFLYDVTENRELRNNQWELNRTGDTVTRTPPPVHVDCSYIVSAWSSAAEGADSAENEHRLLGQVMQVLLRHSKLPAAILQGSLRGQAPPWRASTVQKLRLQSMGEFWQAIDAKPRAALNYTVTMRVAPFTPLEAGPPITDKRITIGQLT